MSTFIRLQIRKASLEATVRGVSAVVAVSATTALAGCDLSVVNAGPIQDEFLDNKTAHASLVTGAERELSVALGFHSLTMGGVTREINPAGNVCSFGITALQTQGILGSEDWEEYCSETWTTAHRARWTAEETVRRMHGALSADEFAAYPLAAEVLLYVGFANRLLGDNMCYAVIDGGPKEPNTVHYKRADSAFTEALAIATRLNNATFMNAARAGRAQVRVGLGDWTGAVNDAAVVPSTFLFQAKYFTTTAAENNRLWRSISNSPARTTTVWNTYYRDYYTETKDPRTPWAQNPSLPNGDAAVGGYGLVPFLYQQKYPTATSPINLASGREMRLIEAEAALRAGNWESAMTTINARRTGLTLAPWTAGSAAEAWTILKRERGIELWLEARRLADLRRWATENTPGALHPLEVTGGALPLAANRSYCAPISIREELANPNLRK
jgi:starch-binding outer membrane protein, SusD/RagB family